MSRYVLITPAHNEEAFIGKTIVSVLRQTMRPLRWVIVNDGSTDGTRRVVENLIAGHEFIELVNVERAAGRHFGNKARAFRQGWERVRELDFDYVGNLDADVSFGPDYFQRILGEFERDAKLGIAGGMVESRIGDRFVSQEVAWDSVAGAVQLFRRRCFEDVGGYLELPHGGMDTAAEVTARMKGWRVRTFPAYRVQEHRRTGSATGAPLRARFEEGRRMHSLGYGFLFFLLRCAFRVKERPRLVGSMAALWGFLAAKARREPLAVGPEVVRYLRAEQRGKLKRLLRSGSAGQPAAGVGRFPERAVTSRHQALRAER